MLDIDQIVSTIIFMVMDVVVKRNLSVKIIFGGGGGSVDNVTEPQVTI